MLEKKKTKNRFRPILSNSKRDNINLALQTFSSQLSWAYAWKALKTDLAAIGAIKVMQVTKNE